MRRADFFAGALLLCSTLSSSLAQENTFLCAGLAGADSAPAAKIAGPQVHSKGTVNVLVVFAKFQGEAPGVDQAPEWAAALFDAQQPGSFAHFYHTMSFGQLRVQGAVLPRRYASEQPASAYVSHAPGVRGKYGEFAEEILRQVDQDIDLGLFDNDGPDGLPNSGDDDGRVDYAFINLLSVPPGFLLDRATGAAGLGLAKFRSSRASTPQGRPVYIHGMRYYSTILQEGSFAQTVGTMAHEFGHSLGLPDLYDTSFQLEADQEPAQDGAGIGHWGLMGWGAHGWNGQDGPVPLCAWSRERLGWIGQDNEQLVELSGEAQMEIRDVHWGGQMYRVPLAGGEYLLLEQRDSHAHYYNRRQPADGLLVWRIRPWAGDNGREEEKLVELVCADGKYQDAGYPLGRVPALSGGDNLDFWAHDEAYRREHQGNLGDATDPFDGVRFSKVRLDQGASAHLLIEVRQQAEGMQVSISTARPPREEGIPTAVDGDGDSASAQFQLSPNYPNPFNAATAIRFVLPQGAQVRLAVYNALGQQVRKLVDGHCPAGIQQVVWDGRDESGQEVASGMYLYRLEVQGTYAESRAMVLVR